MTKSIINSGPIDVHGNSLPEPFLSILVPAFNEEKRLPDTLGEIVAFAEFLPPRRGDYDIAIGSREIEGAVRFNEPFYRHLMGRVFNLVVELLVLPDLRDTQCGFKCLKRDVARDLFSTSEIDGWSFDVEILYIARLRGYLIVEVPVDWYYGEMSKVNPRDTFLMLKEVLRIRENGEKGLYSSAISKQ